MSNNELNIQGKMMRHLRGGEMTQAALALRLQISNTQLSDIETGRRKLSKRLRAFVADGMGVDEGLLIVAGAVDDSPHLDFIAMADTHRQVVIRLIAERYLCVLDVADIELLVEFIKEANNQPERPC